MDYLLGDTNLFILKITFSIHAREITDDRFYNGKLSQSWENARNNKRSHLAFLSVIFTAS